MNRMRIASRAGAAAIGLGLVATITIGGASSARGASLRVLSANVSQAGETAQVCVALESAGAAIAGIQNDLMWDTNCATLSGGTCQKSGDHGKEVNTTMPGGPNSNLLRAIVISLSDTNPIGDAVLYCCSFRSELTQSGTCAINVANAKASTPDAQPLTLTGIPGGITFTGRGSQGGGVGGGGSAAGGPPSAVGGAPAAGAGAAGGAAAGAGGVAGGVVQPPSQVLQGGTDAERLAAQEAMQQGQVVAATPAPGAPGAAAAGDPGAVVAPGDGGAAVPAATAPAAEGTPAETPATFAPTEAVPAPTAPALGTPTAKAAAPTVKPTAPPTVAPTAKSESGGGWFGCQLSPAAGAGSLPWLLGLGALLLWRRTRQR